MSRPRTRAARQPCRQPERGRECEADRRHAARGRHAERRDDDFRRSREVGRRKTEGEEEGLDRAVPTRSVEGSGSDDRASIPRRDEPGSPKPRRRRPTHPPDLYRAGPWSRGQTTYGIQNNLWAPAATGRLFDLSPTSLKPLEAFREHLTIISNTDVPSADPTEAREIGGDHYRSSAAYLTQSYPKRTDGADVECGISLDQLHAQRFGQDTPIPSGSGCYQTLTSPADAALATRAPTPTPSAGRRRTGRCR